MQSFAALSKQSQGDRMNDSFTHQGVTYSLATSITADEARASLEMIVSWSNICTSTKQYMPEEEVNAYQVILGFTTLEGH